MSRVLAIRFDNSKVLDWTGSFSREGARRRIGGCRVNISIPEDEESDNRLRVQR